MPSLHLFCLLALLRGSNDKGIFHDFGINPQLTGLRYLMHLKLASRLPSDK